MIIQYIVIFVLIPGSLLDSMCKLYKKDKHDKLITVWNCCEGYQKVVGELRCVAICKEFCGNGTCVSPNKCQCDKGYQNVNNEIDKSCVPKCSGGCTNGNCVAPEDCKCDPGYELVKSIGNCTPICTGGCDNGHCVAPGDCICNSGFEKVISQDDLSGTGYPKCVPVCESECAANRTCVAPNQCNCTGDLVEMDNVCVPAISEEPTNNQPEMHKLSNNWIVSITIGIIFIVLVIYGAILFNNSRNRGKYRVAGRQTNTI